MVQVNLRRPEDAEALDHLQDITGILNASDAVRFVITQYLRENGTSVTLRRKGHHETGKPTPNNAEFRIQTGDLSAWLDHPRGAAALRAGVSGA